MANLFSSSPYIEGALIQAEDFNLIPDLDQQESLPVHNLGSVFQRHGVDDKYSVILLHRHYPMSEGYIAFTTRLAQCSHH